MKNLTAKKINNTEQIFAEMENVKTRSGMAKRTDPPQVRKSLRTKAFHSVKFFFSSFFFWSSVFGIWKFWFFHRFQVSVSLLASFSSPPSLPPSHHSSLARSAVNILSVLTKSFLFPFFSLHVCRTVFFFFSSLPSASSLTLQSKSGAQTLLDASFTAADYYLVSLSLPLRSRVLSILLVLLALAKPPSVAAAASPHPSGCIFGFRRLRRGDAGQRDGDKVGVGSDGEMALVERRGRTMFFLLDLKLH